MSEGEILVALIVFVAVPLSLICVHIVFVSQTIILESFEILLMMPSILLAFLFYLVLSVVCCLYESMSPKYLNESDQIFVLCNYFHF